EPATGIVCQNRGASFSLDPSHPNVLAGGRRPAHTLMPVMAGGANGIEVVAGTMGGLAQPQILAHLLVRLRAGASAADAVSAPRWVVGGLEMGSPRAVILAERALGEGFEHAVAGSGMPVEWLEEGSDDVGHANVLRLESKELTG